MLLSVDNEQEQIGAVNDNQRFKLIPLNKVRFIGAVGIEGNLPFLRSSSCCLRRATCLAITFCLSSVIKQSGHTQSLKRQNLLWPKMEAQERD